MAGVQQTPPKPRVGRSPNTRPNPVSMDGVGVEELSGSTSGRTPLSRTRTLSSRQIRQRGSLRSKSVLTGSAALVNVLLRKWLQPSGFTQNVQRTSFLA